MNHVESSIFATMHKLLNLAFFVIEFTVAILWLLLPIQPNELRVILFLSVLYISERSP
jgi:hypothetical protein